MSLKNNKTDIGIFGLCTLFCFVIITICCQSSFLYPFNEEVDVNCFYTVSRCLLDGKVLYKEIYEHKGLYTYFIYGLAYLISPNNFIGSYIIEIVCAVVFSFFSYKSCLLITKNSLFSFCSSVLAVVITYTSVSYQEGGFVEDFSIPLIAVIIYLVVRWNVVDRNRKSLYFYYFLTGFITGILFWIKYTMIGCVLGLVLYTLFVLIKRKKMQILYTCGFSCLCGFVVASVPCFLYFYFNDALYDLIHVYFYNLLFIYNGGGYSGLYNFMNIFIDGGSSFWIFNASGIILLFLADIICGDKIGKTYRTCIEFMYITSIIVLVRGVLYWDCYQVLSLFPFLIFGFTFCWELFEKIKKVDIARVFLQIHDFVYSYYLYISLGLCLILAVLQSTKMLNNSFVMVLVIVYLLLIVRVNNIISRVFIQRHKLLNVFWTKYLFAFGLFTMGSILQGIYLLDNNLLGVSAALTVFYWITGDWIEIRELFFKIDFRKYVRESRFFKFRMGMLSVLILSIFCVIESGEIGYIACDYENTVQYKFSQIIENSGIENPMIEGYEVLDIGLYNSLGILPQTKYYGDYNIDIIEVKNEKENIIGNGIADFVYTSARYLDDPILSKYKVVGSGVPYSVSDNYTMFYLLQRRD